ncbi:MAG: ABC transporter ATP-binding protein [Oscillospiraceae bacterium]|nr:ABC transporter ATP-binding protein [Oscillospiraceae bacterium]
MEKKNEKSSLTRASFIRSMLKGSLTFFMISMIMSAAAALLDLISPRIVSCVVDNVLGSVPAAEGSFNGILLGLAGGADNIRAKLYIPALAVAVVAFAGALTRYIQGLSNSVGAEKLVKRIRNVIFSHTDRLPMSWYGKNQTGDILQRCTSDVETVKQFVSVQLTSFVRIILLVVLSIAFMSSVNVTLTIAAAAFLPVIIGYSAYFHGRIGKTFMEADSEEGVVSSIVQEDLTGIRVVRAFGKEAYECERFTVKNEKYTALWVRLMDLMAAFWSLGDLISGLQIMTITVLGAVFCVHKGMTAGNFIAFISYNAMLSWPVRELGRTIADLSRAGVAIDRIIYILNADPEDLQDGAEAKVQDAEPLLVLEDVSYSYTDGTDVLKGIDMHVSRGEKIGIIGGTGSGKSTLTDILMRTCDPERLRGKVRFCGKDADKYPLAPYRRRFARVLQEPFLFSGTISHNIGIASDSITEEQILTAAEDAALMTAVDKFKDGLETFVGERGVTLSGGQKQRCALAACLANADNADVLILDDAFSALDAETDSRIRKTLFSKYPDTTMIIIAHRITTIAGCDRIYVLDKGQIVGEGTHAELITQEGIYRDIYELQTGT